ncbi:hypothetical protein TrCOL_g1556 [Triparma columacea]|uniref:Uncharacterized protein n=1 Tax=Triparma columacea TaxID=722753 RepID=A0A9W7L6V5_9STRA|nr:hypothetical protein TrCOL_g1556 [Triparma columacea]
MEGRRKQQEKIVVNDASIDNLRSVLKAAQNGETQSAARKEKKNEGVREREEKDRRDRALENLGRKSNSKRMKIMEAKVKQYERMEREGCVGGGLVDFRGRVGVDVGVEEVGGDDRAEVEVVARAKVEVEARAKVEVEAVKIVGREVERDVEGVRGKVGSSLVREGGEYEGGGYEGGENITAIAASLGGGRGRGRGRGRDVNLPAWMTKEAVKCREVGKKEEVPRECEEAVHRGAGGGESLDGGGGLTSSAAAIEVGRGRGRGRGRDVNLPAWMTKEAAKGREVGREVEREDERNTSDSAFSSSTITSANDEHEKEYSKAIDEFGRTVYLEVGSRQWCVWAARQGRQHQMTSIWEEEGSSAVEGDFEKTSDEVRREQEKQALIRAHEETEVIRQIKRAKREIVDSKGGDGIRVYNPTVALPGREVGDYNARKVEDPKLDKKETKKERLMRLKKEKAAAAAATVASAG